MKLLLSIMLFFLMNFVLKAQTFEWGKTFGGSQSDVAQRIKLSDNGSVFTAGGFSGQLEISDTLISGYGFQDVFVTCHSEQGSLIWASALGGSGTDQLSALCVDNFGDVWIAGRFTGKIDVDPGPDSTLILSQPANSLEGFLIKLSGTDGSLLDYRNLTSGGIIDIRSIKTDSETDDIFIGGQYANTVDFDFGSGFQLRTSNVTSGDCFVGRYTGDFNFNWMNTFGSTNASVDFVSAVDFDSQGGLYCTGMLGGTADIDPGIGTTNLSCFIDAFLIKYSRSNGQLVWGFNLGGNSLESGNALTISEQDEIVISGTMNSTSFDADPGFGIVTLNSGGITAVPFIARYESSGQINSAFALQGASGLTATISSLQFTVDSYLVAGGYYKGTINFTEAQGGPLSYISGDSTDAFVVVYTVDNRLRDIINITGSGNQQVSDILISGPLSFACGQLDKATSPQQGVLSPIIPGNSTSEAFLFRYNENPTSNAKANAASNNVSLFPNPAKGFVNIDGAFNSAQLIDISGRILVQASYARISLETIPSGLYFVKVNSPNGIVALPLLIGN